MKKKLLVLPVILCLVGGLVSCGEQEEQPVEDHSINCRCSTFVNALVDKYSLEMVDNHYTYNGTDTVDEYTFEFSLGAYSDEDYGYILKSEYRYNLETSQVSGYVSSTITWIWGRFKAGGIVVKMQTVDKNVENSFNYTLRQYHSFYYNDDGTVDNDCLYDTMYTMGNVDVSKLPMTGAFCVKNHIAKINKLSMSLVDCYVW